MSYPIDDAVRGAGLKIQGIGGETVPPKSLVYLNNDGSWYLANAVVAATMPGTGIAIGGLQLGRRGEILLQGLIGNDAWTWIPGDSIYASTVAGTFTQIPPSDPDQIQQVGMAITPTMIYFDPNDVRPNHALANHPLAIIPTMDDPHIPNLEGLSYGGAFATDQIPNLATAKITSGQFPLTRMPRSTSGLFLEGAGVGATPIYNALIAGDIPNLDVAKITTGRFGMPRMPDGTLNYVLKGMGAGLNPAYGEVAWGEVTGKPSTFPPSAHEPTHISGGADDIDSALDGRAITLTTQGDLVYASGANTLARLAAGTAGQTLKTGGAGANPSWTWDKELDNAPDATDTGNGLFTQDTVGESVIPGDVVYMKADGKYWRANAGDVSTMPAKVMAMETKVGDATCKLLHIGYFREDSRWNWTLGNGETNLLFVHTVAGDLVQFANKPSGTGDQVQVVGYVVTADIIFFNPSYMMVEIK